MAAIVTSEFKDNILQVKDLGLKLVQDFYFKSAVTQKIIKKHYCIN